jgi:hypothetical protein
VTRRGLCALLALLLAVAAGGCNYFRAAQPEAPTAQPFTPSYISPEATLQTMVDALADKAVTIGLTAYLGALAESTTTSTPGFHQLFWPTDAAAWESSNHTVPPDWNLSLERNFYIFFVKLRSDNYELEWAEDEDLADDQTADIAHLHRHYRIRTLAVEDGSVTSTLAIGFADLTLVRFDDAWKITLWADRIDPNADPNDPEQMTLGRRRLNTTQ